MSQNKNSQIRSANSTLFATQLILALTLNTVWMSVVHAADATQLEQINVEQSEEPATELPLGIGVSGETLSQTPGSGGDPLRSVQSLPGMVFNDDESAEPAVRGSRPGDNYYQTDFSPSNYIFHQGGAISVFNGDLIDSFSIYPSAYGPEFSGITGGVFDVKLRDPQTDRFHTTLDLNFIQAGFLFEGPINENQSFYLAARRSYLDLIVSDLIEEDGVKITSFPNYTDYQAKYVWHLGSDSTIRIRANGATDDFEAELSAEAEDIATDPVFAGRFFEATRSDEQAVIWNQKINEKIDIQSVFSHNRLESDAKLGGAGDIDVREDSLLLKSHITVHATEAHELKLGAEIEHADVSFDIALNAPACSEFEPDCLFTGAQRLEVTEKAKINTFKAFVKDSWSINDRLTVYPGIALQQENYLDKKFLEPRLAFEYSLRDDLLLKGGLGLNHQMPSVDEVNEIFGNPQLDYIEARHVSLGLEKEFANGWSVSSEIYTNQLDNLVNTNDDTRYDNEGEGRSIGIDTLVRKRMTDKMSGWLSVSLSDATRKDKKTGKEFDFEYDQPVNVSMVGSYRLSPGWTLGAKLWVHSGAPHTPVIGATADAEIEGLYNPQYAELNSERLPAFKRLDLRLDREFKRRGNRQTTAYVELLNIAGSDNISGYSYNADYSVRTPVEQLPGFLSFGIKTAF